MPRPKKPLKMVQYRVQISEVVVTAFEDAIADDLMGKAPRGRRSTIIESLLRNWLNERNIPIKGRD